LFREGEGLAKQGNVVTGSNEGKERLRVYEKKFQRGFPRGKERSLSGVREQKAKPACAHLRKG